MNLGTIEAASSSSDAVSGSRYVGGLVGDNSGTVTAASATGAVTGTGGNSVEIGGLAGYNSGGVSGSSARTGNVSGTAEIGGLIGYNASAGALSGDSASGAAVSGTTAIGGLVGENMGTIQGASSSADGVSGTRYVGGLAGYSTGAVTSASATGAVSGTTDVGGFAGYNGGELSHVSAAGSVTGAGATPTAVGGLVGDNGAAALIVGSEASGGDVSAPDGVFLGGLVGENQGQINRSFSTEDVSANGAGEKLGGLVGYNTANATINSAYATGSVGAGAYIGGLIGYNLGSVRATWNSGTVASGATSGGVAGANGTGGLFDYVYWDVGTTGLSKVLGVGTAGSSEDLAAIGGTTGKSPYSQATYAGFNFTSIWTINPGSSRPYLRNITPQTPPN
jgi:hypothetical protein